MIKTKTLRVRCTETEHLMLMNIAAAEAVNKSEALRHVIREQARRLGFWPPALQQQNKEKKYDEEKTFEETG